jgi:hypothetical protein
LDILAEDLRIPIVLTDYDDRGGANIHLNAVRQDKYAALLDLEYEMHRKKLEQMCSAGSKYNLFWTVVKSQQEVEDRINRRYKENMRRYITSNTNWRIGREQPLTPKVDVTFGELFITLKYGSQTLRIKFEDIEKS